MSSYARHIHNIICFRLTRGLALIVTLWTLGEGSLLWLTNAAPHGLHGTYYANPDWQGVPCQQNMHISDFSAALTRQIGAACSANHGSVELTGYFWAADTAEYTFFAESEAGIFLALDGVSITTRPAGTIHLQQGLHALRIRSHWRSEAAPLNLFWKKHVVYYTGQHPFTADVLYPPDLNRAWFPFYRAGSALLPLWTVLWIFLLLLFVSSLVAHDRLMRGWTACRASFRRMPRAVSAHFIITFCVLTAAMYCSTGTLAPYANTLNLDYPGYPTVEPNCRYLYNGDYGHFEALFLLLDGAHPDAWKFTVLARRILYNIAAYPFMKLWGHDLGGLFTNLLLTWSAFITCAIFWLRNVGEHGAKAGMWLFALYPGITYYSGQPFLYAIITPATVWLYLLLRALETRRSPAAVGFLTLGMGILFTGYDLIIFFGLAALVLVLLQQQWRPLPLAAAGMVFPSLLWLSIFRFYYGGAFRNSNTQAYATILKSYFSPKDVQKWFDLLKDVPRTAVMNFFFSNFFFLPCFFVCVVLLNLLVKHNRLTRSELIITANIALVFLLNNLAPVYQGWQMRGEWIARLYQPIFIVMFMYSVRSYQAIMRKSTQIAIKWGVYGVFIFTLIGNGLVIFGPLLNDPFRLSSQVYWRFYQHSGPDSMTINLARYGRRPIGLCRKQP